MYHETINGIRTGTLHGGDSLTGDARMDATQT